MGCITKDFLKKVLTFCCPGSSLSKKLIETKLKEEEEKIDLEENDFINESTE